MEVRGFWQWAQAEPSAPAIFAPGGATLTAGELLAACNRIVHGLRARGFAQGDCLATLLPNGSEVLEALMGIMQAGAYFTPLNTHLAPAEIAYILRDSGAAAFVAHERFAEKALAAAGEAGLPEAGRFAVGRIPGFRSWEELQDGQPDSPPDARIAGQFLQYTSGTTGRPKGIQRPIHPLEADPVGVLLAQHLSRFGIQPAQGNVHLCTSPMYHTAPLAFTCFALHYEHPVALMERWDPERALACIEERRVTWTHMVPTQFHRLLLLKEETRGRYDVSSLRQVLHAAAPCPVETKRRMLEWWGPVIYEYYGATEGGGTLVSPEEWLERPGTVGRPWAGAEVRILDAAGAPCPTGTAGTVYMKLLQGFDYKGDPEKTRSNRRGDFFTVGDVGYLDDAGYLFLCDRKIDMIISGGVNVYPAEVEAALFQDPRVGDVAVFGIPDEDWGEQVKAVVEPAPGVTAGPELKRSLLEACRERLASYKCPRSIDFTDAMPRDPNGKLYKRRLRDPYWEGRERRI